MECQGLHCNDETNLKPSQKSNFKFLRSKNALFQELTRNVPSKKKFHDSLRAIGMLTEASLILKKLPPQTIVGELDSFTRRFNAEFLGTTDHHIMIPFRKGEDLNSKYPESNYVVGIVEGDCACFPTRKRVPYRIIIETIDPKELW